MESPSRRTMLKTVLTGAAAGFGPLGFLRNLPPVAAEDAKLDPQRVQLSDDIAPLVQLLESTGRDELLEVVSQRIRGGTSYREILAALLLTAVRNVAPRPAVGFKFHAVLVVNSAHLASLASRDEDRWLPIFWALDYVKSKQLEEERTSGWKLPAVDEKALPSASRAEAEFVRAMDRWDPEAADAAVAQLARTHGANQLYEIFYRYGARDFRSIGHKAIFVANSWRTLQCIGWQYAEPVLRSLTFALLNHHGEPNPADSDLAADRPGRRNQELQTSIRPDWLDGTPNKTATTDMLAALREGSPHEASQLAVEMLNRGIAAQSLWDAVLVGSGELLMRQPGIVGLHALTTANALHYAYRSAAEDSTRQRMLLQNCSFLPMFRDSARDRGAVADSSIADLQPVAIESDNPVGEVLADISRDRSRAANKVLSYVSSGGDAMELMSQARRLVFTKGNDAHDYKYSSAVLEDYHHVSPAWRDTFLALSVFNLRGSEDRDNRLVQRTRAALETS